MFRRLIDGPLRAESGKGEATNGNGRGAESGPQTWATAVIGCYAPFLSVWETLANRDCFVPPRSMEWGFRLAWGLERPRLLMNCSCKNRWQISRIQTVSAKNSTVMGTNSRQR